MNSAGISNSVGDFEKVFEDMDVKVAEMDGAMENVYGTTIDAAEVDNLLSEMQGASVLTTAQKMAGGVG